jgi:hypothetical protein
MKWRHMHQRQLELAIVMLGLFAFWTAVTLAALSLLEAAR